MGFLRSQHTWPGKSEQKLDDGGAHCRVTNNVQRMGSPKGELQRTRSFLLHKPPTLGLQLTSGAAMGEVPTSSRKSPPHGSDVTLQWVPRETGEG